MEVLHSLCLIFVLIQQGLALQLPTGKPTIQHGRTLELPTGKPTIQHGRTLELPTGKPTSEIDHLKHWATGNLDLARSETVEEGKDLILACTPAFNDDPFQCSWETPSGDVWYVDRANGQVLQSNNETVEGVKVWGTGATCGILVNGSKVDAGLMGDWSCTLAQSSIFIEGRLNTEDEVTTNLRLPANAVPVNYELWLRPDLRDNQEDINRSSANMSIQFTGCVQMTVRFTQSSPSIVVHTDGLTIKNIFVDSVEEPDVVFTINKVALDFQRTFAQIYLESQMFEMGKTYIISIDYEADLVRPEERSHYGFYRIKCPYESQKDCWYTHHESTYARNTFPCLDEPTMKATFDIHVRRKAGWIVLSNMPLEKTEPTNVDGWLWDTFAHSVIMSPYLAAVTVTDMVPLKSPVHNTTIWASQTDIDLGRADYAKDIAPRIVTLYEKYFNVKYSLPKMDLMSEEDKFTSEENWGLITFDPTQLLLEPNNTDPEVKWEVTRVTAHEIAHQWFGNLVTLQWWSQTWLNEGFASFVSYIGCAEVYPEGNGWGRLVVDEAQHIMSCDGDTTTNWALSDEVIGRSDIGRKFRDPLFSYLKGNTIIRMMESILTKSTFNKGLTSYLTDLSFGNAVEDDLFMHLEAISIEDGKWPQDIDKSFSEVMKTWTNQAGLPLVTALRSCLNGSCSLNISQTQYITKGDAGQKELHWNIPLTGTTVGGPNDNWNITTPCFWMTTEMHNLPGVLWDNLIEDMPFVLNIQNVGYYRVNYDEENWKLIADTLMNDRNLIHPFNRAQIICDVLHLEASGHITEDTKQLVLSYVDKEDDPIPLRAYHKCQEWANKEDSIS